MSDSGTGQYFDREGRLTTPPIGGSVQQAERSACDEVEEEDDEGLALVGAGADQYPVACPVGDEDKHYEVRNKHDIPEQIDGPKHDFLLTNSKYDLLEISAAFGELIERLPKTATTFAVTDEAYEDDFPEGIGKIPGFVRHKIAQLHGAWLVPNRISNRTDTYVNPESVHASHHSDAAVWCDYCGELIHQHDANNTDAHGEDCPIYGQWATRSRLAMKRERIVREVAPLGVNGALLAKRLNLSPDTDLVLPSMDRTAFRDEYMERRANTITELLIRGFEPRKIAAAYGRDRRRVTKDAKKVLGMTPTEIHETYDMDLEQYARE